VRDLRSSQRFREVRVVGGVVGRRRRWYTPPKGQYMSATARDFRRQKCLVMLISEQINGGEFERI
jgi:hypothetical protein